MDAIITPTTTPTVSTTTTQLINGSLWDTIATFKLQSFPDDYPVDLRCFYSPQDRCHEVLRTLIGSATTSVAMSMYGYDDNELNDILIQKAADPNIYVQISLDSSQAAGKAESDLVKKLCASPNTRVAIGQSEKHRILHLKLTVVDGLYTLGGSMNLSGDGESLQANELRVIRNRVVAHEATMRLNFEHEAILSQMQSKAASLKAAPVVTGG